MTQRSNRVNMIISVLIALGTGLALAWGLCELRDRSISGSHHPSASLLKIQVARENMLDAYRTRGALLQEWIGNGPARKDPALLALLSENTGLTLLTQPEFDRFDWVQEQLNSRVSNLLANPLLARKMPKRWIATEREILSTRASYQALAETLPGTPVARAESLAQLKTR